VAAPPVRASVGLSQTQVHNAKDGSSARRASHNPCPNALASGFLPPRPLGISFCRACGPVQAQFRCPVNNAPLERGLAKRAQCLFDPARYCRGCCRSPRSCPRPHPSGRASREIRRRQANENRLRIAGTMEMAECSVSVIWAGMARDDQASPVSKVKPCSGLRFYPANPPYTPRPPSRALTDRIQFQLGRLVSLRLKNLDETACVGIRKSGTPQRFGPHANCKPCLVR